MSQLLQSGALSFIILFIIFFEAFLSQHCPLAAITLNKLINLNKFVTIPVKLQDVSLEQNNEADCLIG